MGNSVIEACENTYALVQKLKKKHGSSPYAFRRAAEELNVHVSYVHIRTRIGALPKDIRDALRETPIHLKSLKQLIKLKDVEEQRRWVASYLGPAQDEEDGVEEVPESRPALLGTPREFTQALGSFMLIPTAAWDNMSFRLQQLCDDVRELRRQLRTPLTDTATATSDASAPEAGQELHVLREGDAAYHPATEFVAPKTALAGLSLTTIVRDWTREKGDDVPAVSPHAVRQLVVGAGLVNDPEFGFWSGTRLEHRQGEAVDYTWRFNDKGSQAVRDILTVYTIVRALNTGKKPQEIMQEALAALAQDNMCGKGDGTHLTLNLNHKEGRCLDWEKARG